MAHYEKTKDYFISTHSSSRQMISMHYHQSFELYYLDEGNRDYFVDDKFFSVPSGSFVLTSPSKLHRTGGSYARRTLVGFTREFLEKTYTPEVIATLLNCFDKVLIRPEESKQNELKRLLKSLSLCKTETEFAIYLGILLSELSKCHSETTYNKQMSDLMTYINRNYADIQSIEQIANHFYISKYHLCRIFKNTMQLTVIDYLNHVKIKNACDLLDTTTKNITEISQLCGFNSPAYFGKVFQNLTGVSPTKYRKG